MIDVHIGSADSLLRLGLRNFVEQEPDFSLVGQTETMDGLIVDISRSEPDVVITSLDYSEVAALVVVDRVRQAYSAIALLTVGRYRESLFAERALRAGASGYIVRTAPLEEYRNAVHTVDSGEVYVSPRLRSQVLQRVLSDGAEAGPPFLDRLSDRELEVFDLLGRGYSTDTISESLHISPATVRTYLSRMRRKLKCESQRSLMRAAVLWVER